MNLDFLTPRVFDMLVIANLIVGLLLMAFRFYQDVRYAEIDPVRHRQQAHNESSYATAPSDNGPSIVPDDEDQPQASQKQ